MIYWFSQKWPPISKFLTSAFQSPGKILLPSPTLFLVVTSGNGQIQLPPGGPQYLLSQSHPIPAQGEAQLLPPWGEGRWLVGGEECRDVPQGSIGTMDLRHSEACLPLHLGP